MYVCVYITNHSAQAAWDTRSIFKKSLTGLNLEFSFSLTCCHTKVKELSLLNCLPIAGQRIVGFISFPKVWVLHEMQTASFRILNTYPFPTTITIKPQVLRIWRCPWCSRYHRRKWTRRHEFKSWTRLIAFHIALIPLGKVWIQLFSLQLWVNSRTD